MRAVDATSGNKSKRRILLVSYWYPPAVGAASERLHGFARHLPAHGWDVHVLTASRTGDAAADDGVTVHAVEDPLGQDRPFADFDPRERPPRWKALARQLVFPDRFVRWQRAAGLAIAPVVATTCFDVVLASFPPASAVRLALSIAEASASRLVLDFRDRWFGPGGYEPAWRIMRRMHERLEARAVHSAARIIVVSDAMAGALAADHGVTLDRVAVIPNGYEVVHRTAAEASVPSEGGMPAAPLVIAHVGTVIARNRPDLFLEALASVRSEAEAMNLRVRFVGNLSADYIRSLGLDSIVSTTGLLDRAAAVREMQSADALLLLTGSYVGRWGASAKLFEYVQTGRPVICLEETPGSRDRALLEAFIPGRAFFSPLEDGRAFIEQTQRVRAYLATRPSPAMELDATFREYSRQNLTAKLALELDRALGARHE